jgi:hypothetical protein
MAAVLTAVPLDSGSSNIVSEIEGCAHESTTNKGIAKTILQIQTMQMQVLPMYALQMNALQMNALQMNALQMKALQMKARK